MRTELLCALAFLCGAEAAFAQQGPVYAYPAPGYAQGYAPSYPMGPRYSGYTGYPSYNYPGYAAAGAAPAGGASYGYYPQYSYAAPAAAPQLTPAPAPSAQAPAAVDLPAGDSAGAGDAPTVPLGPGHGDKPFHRGCNECFWVSVDGEMSWFRPMAVPGALATTGSPVDALPSAAGQPGTGALFGDKVDFKVFTGVHMEAGLFVDPDNHFSIDGAGFFLSPNTVHFQANSDALGNPIIGRPIFNVATSTNAGLAPLSPREYAETDSFPGEYSGSNQIDAKSELYGFEVNGRYHAYLWERLHVEVLAGFRTMRLSESLEIQDQLNPLVPGILTFLGTPGIPGAPATAQNVNPGSTLFDLDNFQTTNTFYGMQIGGKVCWEEDWFSVSAFAKLAAGANQQEVNISGLTTLVTPTGTQSTAGGILALPSNIGDYHRTIFAVVPEAGFTFGADITHWMRATVGYSFLAWNGVVRPGNQIDRNVNVGEVPSDQYFGVATGPAAPLFHFTNELFWVNTLNFGLEFHY